MISLKKSCTFLGYIELSLIHLFCDFLTYLLSLETKTALKVAIKYFCPTGRFRVAILNQLALLDPCDQSAIALTA